MFAFFSQQFHSHAIFFNHITLRKIFFLSIYLILVFILPFARMFFLPLTSYQTLERTGNLVKFNMELSLCGTMVKLQQSSEDSAHDLSGEGKSLFLSRGGGPGWRVEACKWDSWLGWHGVG